MRIAVTGIGIISALGRGLEDNLISLRSQQMGIGKAKHLNSALTQSHVFGEIATSNKDFMEEFGCGELSRTSLLGICAIKEALAGKNYSDTIRKGLLSGTTVGGMDLSEQFYKEYKKSGDDKNIGYLLTHDCGDTSDKIAAHFGDFSYVNTISTACSSSANTIMAAAKLIKSGQLDMVVAGGADPLSAFTANGFNSLMILDNEWCKPFSENRRGLNLGEAAAYLVLESEDSAKKGGREILAFVSGYANANDAYHQTASSPEGRGATMAMEQALKVAGLVPSDISYINAHGTGTQNNDQSESIAIQNVFGDEKPPISSTKAYTGHTLAAAGAVEAVFSILSLRNQEVYPNLNFQDAMTDNNWTPVQSLQKAELKHVLSNSFGFGGNNSTLILSKA